MKARLFITIIEAVFIGLAIYGYFGAFIPAILLHMAADSLESKEREEA